jgi:hypothetical protein
MTQKAMKKIEALRVATVRHSSYVRKQLSRSGRTANSGMLYSAAKYCDALKKLANK